MRSIIILCFAICFLPTFLLGQSFYEVFQGQDPHPTGFPINTEFGKSVDIHGNWVSIGSFNSFDEDSTAFKDVAGAVYTYLRDPKGQWEPYQKLVASDRQANDLFGISVSVHNQTILIGAHVDDYSINGNDLYSSSGSAYVFSLDSTTIWQETQKLHASDPQEGALFGQSVVLEEDYAFIGAPRKQLDVGNGNILTDVGAVYVFQKDSAAVWSEVQKLGFPNPTGGERFGRAVDMEDSWVAIGASQADRNAQGQWLTDAGAVFIFHRDSTGQWNLTQTVTPSDRAAFDWFGSSVSMEDSLLMVGSIWDSEDSVGQNSVPGAGSAYIFRLQPNGQWIEQQKVSGASRAVQANFGVEVSINQQFALVGSNRPSPNSQVQVFENDGERWHPIQSIYSQFDPQNDGFGESIAIDNATAVIAAPHLPEYMYIFEACNLEETVLRDTICPNSGYDFGGEWLIDEGIYIDSLADFRGCDSIVQLDLAILPPQSNVYEINDGLTISAPGASVQWLDCLNGYAPVMGATDPQFFPQQSGSYAAAISQYNCVDTSICTAFVVAGIETDLRDDIQVFPNPVEHTLQLSSTMPMDQVWLHNVQGQVLKQASPHDISLSIDMSDFPAGVYLLQIQTSQGILRQKILKQ